MELSQLYHDTRDVGKRIKGTKTYHLWEFVMNSKFYKIEMFHSRLSGKKKLCLDSQVLLSDKSYQNNFNYSFRIQNYNMTFTQINNEQFELRINNRPFEMLIFEERNGKNFSNNDDYNKQDYPSKGSDNRVREINQKEEMMKESGNKKGKNKKSKFDFFKGHNGFSGELNRNDEDEEFDFDYNDHDDFNIENHNKYRFPQTDDNDNNDNKRDIKKRFSFEVNGSKGLKKMGSGPHVKEERPKSKFIPQKMINEPIIHDSPDNIQYNKVDTSTFEHNRNIFNSISLQNTQPPITNTINPNISSNNVMESFFSNESTCPQSASIIAQNNFKENNTSFFQQPMNNNSYHLINHPLQYNNLAQNSFGNNYQPQTMFSQPSYPSQEPINYQPIPPNIINTNPYNIQPNTRYQPKDIPTSLSFETNSSLNTTNQSDLLTKSDPYQLQQKPNNIIQNNISSNLVDMSNLLGNHQQEIMKNNNFDFQFKTPNGFQ